MMLCYFMLMLNYFLVVSMLGFNTFGGPFPGQGSDDVIFSGEDGEGSLVRLRENSGCR